MSLFMDGVTVRLRQAFPGKRQDSLSPTSLAPPVNRPPPPLLTLTAPTPISTPETLPAQDPDRLAFPRLRSRRRGSLPTRDLVPFPPWSTEPYVQKTSSMIWPPPTTAVFPTKDRRGAVDLGRDGEVRAEVFPLEHINCLSIGSPTPGGSMEGSPLGNSPANSGGHEDMGQQSVVQKTRSRGVTTSSTRGALPAQAGSLTEGSDRSASFQIRPSIARQLPPSFTCPPLLPSSIPFGASAYCPIKDRYYQGQFFHLDTLVERFHEDGGDSNPPPWIWEAHERLVTMTGCEEDWQLVMRFMEDRGR